MEEKKQVSRSCISRKFATCYFDRTIVSHCTVAVFCIFRQSDFYLIWLCLNFPQTIAGRAVVDLIAWHDVFRCVTVIRPAGLRPSLHWYISTSKRTCGQCKPIHQMPAQHNDLPFRHFPSLSLRIHLHLSLSYGSKAIKKVLASITAIAPLFN